MPNYCTNILKIDGDKDIVSHLLDMISSEHTYFDFNKIIPYPEKYAKMDSVNNGSSYNAGGYQWCIENWGTMGNAISSYIVGKDNHIEIHFTTAWSPPSPVINALVKLFPKLHFRDEFEGEGGEFEGFREFENGECIKEEEDDEE